MKMFTKFCLILAGALCVLGIVGVGVGMAMGARPGQFLNLAHYDNSIFRWLDRNIAAGTDDFADDIDAWSEDLEDDIDTWSEDLEDDIDAWTEDIEEGAENWGRHWSEGHHNWDDSFHSGQFQPPSGEGLDTFEDSFAADEIKKLKLELNFAVLHIYAGEENSDVRISGRNGLDYFRSRLDGDTLELEDTRNYRQYQREQALELELWLPPQSFEQIELELGASEADMESLWADKIRIDVGAGLLDAEHIEGKEVELDIGVGSCTASELLASQRAEFDVGSGELILGSFSGNAVNLDCGMGSAEITLPGQETDYNYKLDCGVGMIRIGSRSYSGLDNSQSIDNGSERTITADCGIGQITLNFE